MKITVRQPDIDTNGSYVFRHIGIDDIIVPVEAVISIDGSTTSTGLSILRKSDAALLYSCRFERSYSESETAVQFKVRLKKAVKNLLILNKSITTVFYEEPFIGYAEAAATLMMLRTFIDEIIVEEEPALDYIKHSEINNLRWKKEFLAPTKVPSGTENQKKAVRAKLVSSMPYLEELSQDEVDALCMGFVAVKNLQNGTEDELASKKVRPFQYDVQFIGADSDEAVLYDILDTYSGPKSILENGITLTSIKGSTNFDKHIYKTMGSEDKVLIVKFSSDHHCNLVLKYKLGDLATSYDYIYAIVWRKTRKH